MPISPLFGAASQLVFNTTRIPQRDAAAFRQELNFISDEDPYLCRGGLCRSGSTMSTTVKTVDGRPENLVINNPDHKDEIPELLAIARRYGVPVIEIPEEVEKFFGIFKIDPVLEALAHAKTKAEFIEKARTDFYERHLKPMILDMRIDPQGNIRTLELERVEMGMFAATNSDDEDSKPEFNPFSSQAAQTLGDLYTLVTGQQ